MPPKAPDQPVCSHPGRGAVARVEVNPVNMRDAGEIEGAVAAFARSPGGGLIVTARAREPSSRSDHRAGGPAQLPALYFERYFVAGGGLMSYGPDLIDQYQRAAG